MKKKKGCLKMCYYISLCSIVLLFVQCTNNTNTQKLGEHKPIIPPQPRLQMDIAEGSPDLQWWRDAKTTRDQRLAWWRDARFGCFIHWGAYSFSGGEWKGKIYDGYAEHIMLKAKIPVEEYRREIVEKFNPVKFNADEWVRTIRNAGMRYLIITAKHHDGFAMYDSEVSDFNIMKATLFGRDPMKELKAACIKYDIKFGFYYSHANDWVEENGTGNDWDFENPVGPRKLFGGKRWYDKHPEMVPRIRKYVDEKAIPQVQELINKYDPDIMWLDTPHHLPPEENLRILKAIHEAKPTIVANSRAVQNYEGVSHHFGDYQSTGDRAVDFPPRNGDWEAIPTTNESYAYHKADFSHKTPDFLIKVLVKAAARGGNVLLNIGPKGDGEIDQADIEILKGIGKWMDVNDASIRGTVRTTLPVQPWGESTRKKNTFYLHVFDWPTSGVIEVGGFLGKVNQVWLLSDKEQSALSHKRIDNRTIQIEVPLEAPYLPNSVVVMDVDNVENTDANRLLSTTTTDNLLRAFDGIAVGGNFKYGNGKADRNGVSEWKNEGQAMTWPVYLTESGKFNVIVEYKPFENSNKFIVESGKEMLSDTTKLLKTGFIMHEIGIMNLPAGNQVIKIHSDGIPKGDLMTLRALHFMPLTQREK